MRRGIQRSNRAVRRAWKAAQGGATNRGRRMRGRPLSAKPGNPESVRALQQERRERAVYGQLRRMKANRRRSRRVPKTKGPAFRPPVQATISGSGYRPLEIYHSIFGGGFGEPKPPVRKPPYPREDNPQTRARQAKFDEAARKRELERMLPFDIYDLAYKTGSKLDRFDSTQVELRRKLLTSSIPTMLVDKNELIALIIRAERMLSQ